MEILAEGGFALLPTMNYKSQITSIEQERQKFEIVGDFLRFKEGFTSSWLLDG